MKLWFYPTIGFGFSKTYYSLKLWTKKYVKYWPNQIYIDFSSKVALSN
jgi:hypothetical protein